MTGRSKVRQPEARASVANRQPTNPAFGLIHPIHSFIHTLLGCFGHLFFCSFFCFFNYSQIHLLIHTFV